MISTPWNGNSSGVEGLKHKCPPWGGGVWIFSGTTQYYNILADLTFTLNMSNWNCKTGVFVVVQFYPWFKFHFPLFWGMVMYDNEFKTKGNKI